MLSTMLVTHVLGTLITEDSVGLLTQKLSKQTKIAVNAMVENNLTLTLHVLTFMVLESRILMQETMAANGMLTTPINVECSTLMTSSHMTGAVLVVVVQTLRTEDTKS